VRARDLGIVVGTLPPGPHNAITDVGGVRVGHATIIEGDGALVVGRGPIRTGVTVIDPFAGGRWNDTIFAGCHRLNGNGELTGLEWIRENGTLDSPIGLTNTHSVGVVHDALIAGGLRAGMSDDDIWSLPVVGETFDGLLNDINGFHVRPDHVDEAMAAAKDGPVAEGNVGGGTGMICHEFKGGIGTTSRVVADVAGGWKVGALVQANYGHRALLRIDGVPVGEAIPVSEVPSPYGHRDRTPGLPFDSGSIIIVLATDAPLLPHQCARLAQRASLGLARMGSFAGNSSGDIFLAFATGNRAAQSGSSGPAFEVRTVSNTVIDNLFLAAVEATEEAIVNALVAAETMTGRDGITAHALPHDRLVEVMAAAGRLSG
jgi:D-aminopeptidase